MSQITRWNQLIITQILLDVNFIITEVNELKEFKNLYYKKEEYTAIINLIKSQDWKSLDLIREEEKKGFGEYLHIIKFLDQNKLPHAVTIYDSDELWQDPVIIEIIPLYK